MVIDLSISMVYLTGYCDVDPVGAAPPLPGGEAKLYHTTVNETWSKMEDLLETGKVRAIGVSNFSIKT